MASLRKNSSLLDIDENIIHKQLLLKDESGPELTSLLPPPAPHATTITPKPGICVKTRDSVGSKVFVNVCTSPEIPLPEDVTDQELIRILESDEPSDFRVPMSIGEPHQEEDKSGGSCVAYDIVINPQFLDKMGDSPLFHNFFMIASMEGLEDKYSITLDKNGWTVLKNKKYQGQMSEQSVRTSRPMVQQLSGARTWTPHNLPPSTTNTAASTSTTTESPLITELSTKTLGSEKTRKTKPNFVLRREKESGGVEFLVAQVELPGEITGSQVEVMVGEDHLVVETKDRLLDVFLPLSLTTNTTTTANFITSQRLLVLRVPVLHI